MRRGPSSVRLRRTTDAQLWDELVDGSPGALPFHDWAWLDLMEAVLGVVFERLVAWDGGRPLGVVPVVRRSARSPRAYSTPFPYVGPLVPPERLADTLRALRRWQLRGGLLVARVEFGPHVTEQVRPALAAATVTVRETRSVTVDLTHGSREEMFARFSKERRRDVRRALRDGASARRSEPGEVAALLPRVLDEAYGAHGAPNPYPEHTGRLVEEWARGRDDVALFTGLVGDEPAGVQVGLRGHGTAIAWVGASLRRFRDANVNTLLYRAVMDWAVDEGCEEIDFCAVVDDGVARYKLAYGGVERPWLVAESSLLPDGLRRGVRDLRRRFGR